MRNHHEVARLQQNVRLALDQQPTTAGGQEMELRNLRHLERPRSPESSVKVRRLGQAKKTERCSQRVESRALRVHRLHGVRLSARQPSIQNSGRWIMPKRLSSIAALCRVEQGGL